jgi:hypothetical protein
MEHQQEDDERAGNGGDDSGLTDHEDVLPGARDGKPQGTDHVTGSWMPRVGRRLVVALRHESFGRRTADDPVDDEVAFAGLTRRDAEGHDVAGAVVVGLSNDGEVAVVEAG